MERKNLLRWVGFISIGLLIGLLLGSSLFTLPAQAQIKLSYANWVPPKAWPAVQSERHIKEIEKRTGGKVKIDLYPAGSLLSAKNTFHGIISGSADMGLVATSYQPGSFPISESIDITFGWPNAIVGSVSLWDLINKYKPKEFEKVKVIGVFTCPPMQFLTTAPVKSLKDLKGMEIRVPGTAVEVLKLLGGTPVAMPATETPEALQRGVVKGVMSSLETLRDLNFAAYCPYSTIVDLQVVAFIIMMNKEKYSSLPSDVKKVIDDLSFEHTLWSGKLAESHKEDGIKWAKEKYNHQIFELPESERKEISNLLQPVIDGYIKRVNALGLPGDQIIKDVYDLQKKNQNLYK